MGLEHDTTARKNSIPSEAVSTTMMSLLVVCSLPKKIVRGPSTRPFSKQRHSLRDVDDRVTNNGSIYCVSECTRMCGTRCTAVRTFDHGSLGCEPGVHGKVDCDKIHYKGIVVSLL